MKKVFVSVLSILFALIILTGCGLFNGCGDIDDNIGGGNNTGGGETVLVKKDFNLFFNPTVTINYKDNVTYVKDFNGNDELFENLLDRQIDVFVQDVIFRLMVIYGKGVESSWLNKQYTINKEPALLLQDNVINKENFAYNFRPALVSLYEILAKPDKYLSDSPDYLLESGIYASQGRNYSNFNLNDIATYAYEAYFGVYQRNLFTDTFHLKNTIGGYYNNNPYIVKDNNLEWNWGYTSTAINPDDPYSYSVYETYYNHYKDQFKTAIANILANKNYNDLTYETALNRIDHLGFSNTDKQKITNFIFNEVIGEYQIQQDRINKPNITLLTSENYLTLTNENRKYKAYDLIIPALLNSAFNNTFVTTTTSIYISKSKLEEKSNTISYNMLNNKNFTSITLKPTSEIKLTKLEIDISGLTKDYLYNITYSVYKGNNLPLFTNARPDLGNSNIYVTNHTITLNFNGYNNQTINTNGYIVINFNIEQNQKFNINLAGFYA